MRNKLIRVNSSTAGRNVSEKRICIGKLNGEDRYGNYAVIEGTRHMIRGSVMNGVHYNERVFDELADQLMKTNARIPAPLSHPSDADGAFVSAKDPICQAHTIGAFDADWRVENGDLLVSNTYINLDMLKGRKDAEWLDERINSKQPIDRSTGLLLNVKAANGIGADGEPYEYDINRIIELDHSAILNPDLEPGAKNNTEGVGMFTNSAGENVEVEEVELTNSISAAMSLPVADKGHKWDKSAAEGRIREYTNSKEKPSANYRKFFAYFDQADAENFGAYKLPFADIIDGKPHAVPAAINAISSVLGGGRGGVNIPEADKAKAKALVDHYNKKIDAAPSNNALKKALDVIKSALLGNKQSTEYNNLDGQSVTNTGNEEDHAMRDKIKKQLEAKGMYKENMTDDEMMTAYDKMKAEKKPASNSADEIAQAVNSAVTQAVEPLTTKINELETQIAANADKEKQAFVNHVVENVPGMTKEIANAMDSESLKSLASANGYVVGNGAAMNSAETAPEGLEIEMPESQEAY